VNYLLFSPHFLSLNLFIIATYFIKFRNGVST